MCLDEEFPGGPRGITDNTPSSTVSSGAIKIGQLFENKAYLKVKLHVYAIKKNLSSK